MRIGLYQNGAIAIFFTQTHKLRFQTTQTADNQRNMLLTELSSWTRQMVSPTKLATDNTRN